MTEPRSSSSNTSAKTTKPDLGQTGLIVLVVLAVVASIVMLISGSAAALKIALIAALWAAVLGFFLVMRYRRQAEESVTKLELQERAHRAELKQARTADGQPLPDQELLDEIRTELASIRKQIEDLSGQNFTYEPAALHAEARRIMQLEAQTAAAARPGSEEGNVDFTQSSSGAPSTDAIAGRLGNQPSAAHAESNPLNDIISEKTRAQRTSGKTSGASAFNTGGFQAVRWDTGGDDSLKTTHASASSEHHGSHRKPEAATKANDETQDIPQQPAPQRDERAEYPGSGQHVAPESAEPVRQKAARPHHRAAEPQPEEQTRGRRRSDDKREGAVSVAELLAQAKKKKDK